METRILLPKQLQLQFINQNNSFVHQKEKKKRKPKNSKEKPTSSSGCGDSEISDSDSDFEIFPEKENSTDSEVEGGEEDHYSGIWNPSYNLRKKGKGPLGPYSNKGESPDGIVVANADSNVQTETSGGVSGGNVGHFSDFRITARFTIEKGTVLSGNEGEVCVVFLKDVPAIKKDDVRFVFGCFDRLIKGDKDNDNESGSEDEDRKQIHLCNWVRFVKQVQGMDSKGKAPNVKGTFVDHQAVFQFLRCVQEGEEILVTFDLPREDRLGGMGQRGTLQQYAPLDLSKSLAPDPPKTSAPISIFPFSINNVLQPGKLFQPFHGKDPSSVSVLNGGHPRNILNLPRSTPPGLQGMSGVSGGLRPILRTRGRERSLLPCEVCGKAFDRPSLLKRHMRTHTGEKPHICDVCSKGFSTSSSLNTHRRIHSGEKPHQCPICGKRFTASSNLYYHRMTHNKEKPHKCLLCGKSFPTPGDLKSHQYVHSGSWPYNCPVCHRGFSKQTNLRNHLLLHSGDKPHNCQICGKKFALACNLRAHLRTHEEEPVSSCITCKRTFLNSLNMLENGQCRACIIHAQSSAPKGPTLFPLQLPPTSTSSGHDVKSESLALSALSKFVTTPPALQFSPLEDAISSANFSLPSASYLTTAAENMSLLRAPNPFLEQFLQWNWRFAKETAGNLGLMQQKLLESQMLAAQLMSVSSNGSISNGDILKFRL